ncbi:MAG: hypothetical protein LBN06_11425 [Prevotellaceae bacterium]|jgi:hypothetical protein|nr:hypothetical protein [Prevotellaceae bacterium]
MKRINKNLLLSAATALMMLAGCDYNEHNFDGLVEGPQPSDVKRVEYTLTADDYGTIANNNTNKDIAAAAGLSDELAALKTNRYFTDAIDAATYMPAFIAAKWFTADEGSSVKVTYDKATQVPEYVAGVKAAGAYTLTASDYAAAWDELSVAYFTPSKPAATYLPRILKSVVTDAAAGDYVAVKYQYSSIDPSAGGDVDSYNKIADAVEGPNGDYNVKGNVVATYMRGFLLSDGTGTILVYTDARTFTNVYIGDEVAVKGATSEYAGFKQFGKTSEITKLAQGTKFPTVNYEELNAAAMDAYLNNPVLKPVQFTGTLSVSGSYYNILIDGAATAQGSLSYIQPGMCDPSLNGKKIIVYGYSIGTSSGKYVNVMATHIVAAETQDTHVSVAEAALSDPGDYTVQGIVLAVNKQGFMFSDGTATMLYYNRDGVEVAKGDIITVSGTTSTYNNFRQFPAAATVAKIGEGTVTYPSPRALEAADMDAYLDAPYIQYVQFHGILSISGNYYNVIIEDATTAQGSIAYPLDGDVNPELNGKEVVVTGYSMYMSGTRYVNVTATSVVELVATKAMSASTRASAAEETRYAMYQFDGTSWAAAADMTMVNPADYAKMGITGNCFSSSVSPDNYLPQFMMQAYPYAQEEEVKSAVYFYGSEGSIGIDPYIYTAGAWKKNAVETTVDQFVYSGGNWNYDPSVVIELLPTKNELTVLYMQTATDWVWENIDQKMGVTEKGKGYVTSYGNNDYYSGCSAYYGNVDMRVDKARAQYAAGYEGLDDAAALALMEEHLIEVMAPTLSILNPDAVPVPGVEVHYTIKLGIYTGVNLTGCTHQLVYKVVDKGKFEYVDGSLQPL